MLVLKVCRARQDIVVLLSVFVLFVVSTDALAASCPVKGRSGGCLVPSGEYFVQLPDTEPGLQRLPVAMILHDAGRTAKELIGDDSLVRKFLDRGYAVIAPSAIKRKYVRASITSRYATSSSFIGGKSRKSEKKYVIKGRDGRLRLLRQAKDRGWYFYTTDTLTERHADLVVERRKVKLRGRDELAFLKEVLFDASQQLWVDPNKVTVVGFGHGAALAWQIACMAPDMVQRVAPVNGAHWGVPPTTCELGGRVVHTHTKNSDFWPMAGTKGTRRRFGQNGVRDTLDLFARSNGCEPVVQSQPIEDDGYSREVWRGCKHGSSVELILSDQEFDFPDWWFDRVFGAGAEGGTGNASPTPEQKSLVRPLFLRPKPSPGQ
ncbi:MAG: dienelactone hydrolase family protein [Pseudomonadota bacterium]